MLLAGCSIFPSFGFGKGDVEPIEIKTQAVERTKLNLPQPEPIKGRNVQWIVVTPENVEEVWKQLQESNTDLVLFAITDNGYEQLALNYAEIRNFIATQRQIIIKYKEYYEPIDGTDSQGTTN